MSEPFVGEIRMFAGNFAPRNWAFCDGQLLAVSQNDALFSLLGTIYGGDGRTTFGLPDLRGRIPLHAGTGPGLSNRRLGAKGGAEAVTLSAAQTADHTHPVQASSQAGTSTNPAGSYPAAVSLEARYASSSPTTQMNGGAITPDQGAGGLPHDNLQPYQCVHFIIALFGVYPSRN